MVDAQIHCVIDNGSYQLKSGFSGEEAPRYTLRSILGKSKIDELCVGHEKKNCMIGPEAIEKVGLLDIDYPINNGIITNWDAMEKIWNYNFFSEMKISPEEHNVLLTESPFNDRKHRETTIEILFEKFNIPGLYLSSQNVLSSYAVGKSTSMSINVGHTSTSFCPLYEGFLCREFVTHIPIAGLKVNETLLTMLTNNGQCLQTKMQQQAIEQIKLEYCSIVTDNTVDVSVTEQHEFELPDKTVIKIGNERYKASEVLFNANEFGMQGVMSFKEAFIMSIRKSDMDIRNELLRNVLFSGGTTLMKGFKERVDKEINDITNDFDCKKKVHCYPEALYTAWIGGSILTSLGNFENLWFKKSEYREHGACLVHSKCP